MKSDRSNKECYRCTLIDYDKKRKRKNTRLNNFDSTHTLESTPFIQFMKLIQERRNTFMLYKAGTE